MMIEFKNVTYIKNKKEILTNISFSISKPGIYGIYGDSGAGKTTILKLILGIIKPSIGNIRVFNYNYAYTKAKEKKENLLNNFGVVYQKENLFSYDTVYNNLKLILKLKKVKNYKYEIKRLLRLVKMEDYIKKPVYLLSGGEKQRIAFIAALAKSPKVLLLDEPMSALDGASKDIIQSLIEDYAKKHIVICVSHDLNYIEKSDEIYHVSNGGMKRSKVNKRVGELEKATKSNSNFPLSFFFSSSLKRASIKKYRVLFMNFLISTGLLTMGLSNILNSSIQGTMYDTLNSFLKDDSYVLSYKDEISPILINQSTIELDSLDLPYDTGIVYENSFSSLLKTKNYLYLDNGMLTYNLPNCGLDNFNLFSYDKTLDYLANDEVVISLSHDDLTKFDRYSPCDLILEVANLSWQYEDEQIFKVVDIIEGDYFSIIHGNKYFNEYVIEERMRFKTYENSSLSVPWRLNKMSVINSSSYYELASYIDNNYPSLLLARCPLDENKYYPYSYHPYDFTQEVIDYYFKNGNIDSYIKNTNGIYDVYPSAFMSGFANDLFISGEEDDLKDFLLDSASLANNVTLNPPSSVIKGSIANTYDTNIIFKAITEELDYDEIVISKALYEALHLKKTEVMMSYNYKSEYQNNMVKRLFETNRYKIKHIYESDDYFIAQSNFWLERIFPYQFLIEANKQIVHSLTLFSNEDLLSVPLVNDYLTLENPLKNVKESIRSTTKSLSLIFGIISILIILCGIILVYIIVELFIKESRQDNERIILLGGNRGDVLKFHLSLNAFILFFTYFSTSLALFFSIYSLSRSSNTLISISLTSEPFLLMLFATLLIFIISCFRVVGDRLIRRIYEK